MLLCLDVGNTQIFGGVFEGDQIKLRFRHESNHSYTSDQFGVFLRTVLRENQIDVGQVDQIAMASVKPSLDYSLRAACKKYFNVEPFMLKGGVKTGLKIKIKHPAELGADLMATAMGAEAKFSNQNLVVIDFGTATTLSVISRHKEYLGTVITPGPKLSMKALGENTAKLFPVDIVEPEAVIGRSTAESIQSGLYYGQLGAIREIVQRIKTEHFADEAVMVIGTGGFSILFENVGLFDVILSDLVLDGLRIAFRKNA